MIPTFNCAHYLGETLASVLDQDPGPAHMQIEVVDDCSTKDNPEAVVRKLSPNGRVTFHRRSVNGGVVANFNTCVSRSRGHLVHLLHGDDQVLPCFYKAVEQLAKHHPSAPLFTTRALIIDETGVVSSVSPLVPAKGPLELTDDYFYINPFLTPTVVVRRSFYENHGGYNSAFSHVADWEMWLRALKNGGAVATPQILAAYRFFQANDTARLIRTADNLKEYLQLFIREAKERPSLDIRRMRIHLGSAAFSQASRFLSPEDHDAYVANRRFYWRMLGRPAGFVDLLGRKLSRNLFSLALSLVPTRTPDTVSKH